MIDSHTTGFTNLLKNANFGLKVAQRGEGGKYNAVCQDKSTSMKHTGFGLDRACQKCSRTHLGQNI